MQLFEVILNVADMEAQTRFYRDVVGLEVQEAGEFWTTFDTGACILALHGGGEGKIGEDAARIVFRVDEIESAREQLIARGADLGEIRSPVEGTLVADGRDPEGNMFHLEEKR